MGDEVTYLALREDWGNHPVDTVGIEADPTTAPLEEVCASGCRLVYMGGVVCEIPEVVLYSVCKKNILQHKTHKEQMVAYRPAGTRRPPPLPYRPHYTSRIGGHWYYKQDWAPLVGADNE